MRLIALMDEIVVKVQLLFITFWKYIDGKLCRDYLNYQEHKACREFYEVG